MDPPIPMDEIPFDSIVLRCVARPSPLPSLCAACAMLSSSELNSVIFRMSGHIHSTGTPKFVEN